MRNSQKEGINGTESNHNIYYTFNHIIYHVFGKMRE